MFGKRLAIVLTVSLLSSVLVAGSAGAIDCPSGQFSIGGVVTDAATGLPLTEVTSVGITQLDGSYADGAGTNADSEWGQCVPAGQYSVGFAADSYYVEWWNNAYNAADATVIVVDQDRADIDASLDRLTVIVGQVVDAKTGVGLSGSIHVENLAGTYLDGEGSLGDGTFSLTLNHVGQRLNPDSYLIGFQMDGHWAEWYDDARRKSRATPVVTDRGVLVIDLGVIELRQCPRPEICIAGNYNR